MENYEKLYKEALERAKHYTWYSTNRSDTAEPIKNAVEAIFPELRESEDERIKKELISFFAKRDEFTKSEPFNGLSSKQIISWLEKQGEQKLIPKYKIGDIIEYRGEKYTITNVTVTDNNFYYDVSLIEEPSDLEEVVTAIGMAAEEQMFKIWQNPTLSEEDEKMKNLIISTLTSIGTINLERYYHMNFDEVENWLKSIKPNHWKPSEEQMEALLYALGKGGTYNHEALTQLYNNLKTL